MIMYAGDLLIEKVPIYSFFGATGIGMMPIELTNGEDWQYLEFSPCLGGEFRPYAKDLHELVIVRNPKYKHAQGVFATFPELKEYPMKDVYSKYPSKPDYWTYRGRTDDIIVFSNAEKLNPVTMEGVISSHPEVLSPLIVGQGYFQPALLIEANQPPSLDADKAKLLESIWPYVERGKPRLSGLCCYFEGPRVSHTSGQTVAADCQRHSSAKCNCQCIQAGNR